MRQFTAPEVEGEYGKTMNTSSEPGTKTQPDTWTIEIPVGFMTESLFCMIYGIHPHITGTRMSSLKKALKQVTTVLSFHCSRGVPERWEFSSNFPRFFFEVAEVIGFDTPDMTGWNTNHESNEDVSSIKKQWWFFSYIVMLVFRGCISINIYIYMCIDFFV